MSTSVVKYIQNNIHNLKQPLEDLKNDISTSTALVFL